MAKGNPQEAENSKAEVLEGQPTNSVEKIDGFHDADLRTVGSMADVLAMTGGQVTSVTDVLGTGFEICENKRNLVDTEFVIVRTNFHKSEVGSKGEFVSLHVVTADGRKLIVNDGSTGIYEQIKRIRDEFGRVAPLHVPKGLRESIYEYTDEKDGRTREASTFYLNTSK